MTTPTPRGRSRRRGQPVVVLGLVLLGWTAMRTMLWESPLTALQAVHQFAEAAPAANALGSPPGERTGEGDRFAVDVSDATERPAQRLRIAGAAAVFAPAPVRAVPPLAEQRVAFALLQPVLSPAQALPAPSIAPRIAGGHAMLWLAAVSQLPLPPGFMVSDRPKLRNEAVAPPSAAPAGPRRWSGDAWLLLRSGGGLTGLGLGTPTYGASQVGAVLRYRLAPRSANRPTAYIRASGALNGSGERELAAGLSVRPLASVPLVIAGEGRVSRLGGRTVIRPAVAAITELPAFELPQGVRAELYGQGGYVGGVGASAFIDGQLRLDRRVARAGPVELRAGAGAWGGAQRGASRLDVGPTATLSLVQGTAAARVGVDWRFRVAGSAQPASGPALTISAGF